MNVCICAVVIFYIVLMSEKYNYEEHHKFRIQIKNFCVVIYCKQNFMIYIIGSYSLLLYKLQKMCIYIVIVNLLTISNRL